MRSRYSAYVLGLEAYLLATWHADTRPPGLDLHEEPPVRWLGLDVKRHVASGVDSAIVEFVARHKRDGRARRLHEISRFVREDGRWYYVDGEFPGQATLKAGQAASLPAVRHSTRPDRQPTRLVGRTGEIGVDAEPADPGEPPADP